MLAVVDVESLGYRTDLMLRRLEGSEITDHGGYLTLHSPSHPEYWWGNFLLMPQAALREDTDIWMSRFAEAFPDAKHVALGVDGSSGSPAVQGAAVPAGYAEAGLRLDRSVVMTAVALREPPHPNHQAQYRPLSSDDDWQAAVELRWACHDGPPGSPADREFGERRAATARQLAESGHGACFGAFRDGRLLAQLGIFSDGSGVARYQNVETHPAARGKGLAGTLVWQAGRYALGTLGASTLVIVADPGYHAIRIYRSVGFSDREIQTALERDPARR